MISFVLATANSGKITEMRKLLSGLDIKILTRDDVGISFDVEETGTTFLENAAIKAQAISVASSLPAIADDSGLVVDSLNGEPGLYSSSYGGVKLTNHERCIYLLSKMKNMEHRTAKFVCTIVCAFPSGDILSATGQCNGTILTKPQGTCGFGYDPVFRPEGMEKSMAELTVKEKNNISHRGIALREFMKILKDYCTEKSL